KARAYRAQRERATTRCAGLPPEASAPYPAARLGNSSRRAPDVLPGGTMLNRLSKATLYSVREHRIGGSVRPRHRWMPIPSSSASDVHGSHNRAGGSSMRKHAGRMIAAPILVAGLVAGQAAE